MPRIAAAALAAGILISGTASACPENQSEGLFGWCYPNVGGELGKAWEKGKDEIANFEADIRTWIETGKCGGDICDAFAAAVQFGKDQVTDYGLSLRRAANRLSEGKPLDALWHLQTDYFNNTQENAADAARRSRLLLATGQVAATAYGGWGGAAAYTAWLTYNTTGNINDAVKAGIISGASAAALGSVSSIDLSGVQGAAARSILTGAINGAAVAASGGSQDDVRTAFAMGVVTVMIREGYRELTKVDLDRQRLRSSTGKAYCLAEIPSPAYLNGGAGPDCLAPPSAYRRNPDNSLAYRGGLPAVNYRALDYDRPHVGMWAERDTSWYNLRDENSYFMTGVSRLPGWNAMAVAHDLISDDLGFSLIPGGTVLTVGTIPPALVLTYMGTGYQIHDAIRETFTRGQQNGATPNTPGPTGPVAAPPAPLTGAAAMIPLNEAPTEALHLFCGVQQADGTTLARRTDLLVNVSAGGEQQGPYRRRCEIRQLTNGQMYNLGHAHHEMNYCHRIAERIVQRRQQQGHVCLGSVGLRTPGPQPQSPSAELNGRRAARQ